MQFNLVDDQEQVCSVATGVAWCVLLLAFTGISLALLAAF